MFVVIIIFLVDVDSALIDGHAMIAIVGLCSTPAVHSPA
jgi:hypothetical protein